MIDKEAEIVHGKVAERCQLDQFIDSTTRMVLRHRIICLLLRGPVGTRLVRFLLARLLRLLDR